MRETKQARPNLLMVWVVRPAVSVLVMVFIFVIATTATLPKKQEIPTLATQEQLIQPPTNMPQSEQVEKPADKNGQEPPVAMNLSPDMFSIPADTVQATIDAAIARGPVVLVTVNLTEQHDLFLSEIAQHDLDFLDAFSNGDKNRMEDEAAWFNMHTGDPDVENTRIDIANSLDSVARSYGFGLSTIDWVTNTIQALQIIGDPNRADVLKMDLADAIYNETQALAQAQEQTVSQPTSEPSRVEIPQQKPQISEQAFNQAQTEINPQLRTDTVAPGFVDWNASGYGLGFSRSQALYTLKRIWAVIHHQKIAGLPTTNYVVGIAERSILPGVNDASTVNFLGMKVRTIQLLLGEDPSINPTETWNEWVEISGPEQKIWEGYKDGHYWRSVELVWIGDLPLHVGQRLPDAEPLLTLDALLSR